MIMSSMLVGLRHGQLLVILGCLLWSVTTRAAEPSFVLSELYQMAVLHDPSVKAAKSVEAVAVERLPQVMAEVSPQVLLSAERQVNQLTRSASPIEYTSSNRTLQVRQPLYRAGFQAKVDQALKAREEAAALREQAERDLLGRLTSVLFEHLLAIQQKEFVDALMAATALQLQAAERTFMAGSGIRTDIDEAKSRLDSAKVQHLQIRLLIESTRRQLERLTGQRVSKVVNMSMDDPWALAPELPDLTVLLAEAELLHPQLRALRARVESTRNEVLKANAVGKPTLDALARVTRSQGENTLNPGSHFSNHQIGVQFNWPIYQGGSQASAVREASAKLEEADQRLLAAKDDLALRLENQYRSVQEGRLRIEALRQAQRSARQVLASSQRSFEAGSRTRLDVMNAHQVLAQSDRDLTQGRLNYLSAELQLALLAGFDSVEAISRISPWFAQNASNPLLHTSR
jgi:outer membrane protein/protease secretion system outer membrane protein